MKKLILLSCIALTAVLFSSFNASENPTEENGKATNSEMWTFMQENVFTELKDLVEYEEEKVFSRCASGFSQHIVSNEEEDEFVYGGITFAEGCMREKFCNYKINWDTKETLLQKTKKDEYVDIDTFVEIELKKIAKI